MNSSGATPQHIAIIMDGNGRWAESRGMQRYEGHVAGIEAVRASVRGSIELGVKYLTLYAFSTENWGRPQAEVDTLMELFCTSVVSEMPELQRQGVAVRIIGDRERFSQRVQEHLTKAENTEPKEVKLTLILALNYSSRDELRRAVKAISAQVKSGEMQSDQICEATIQSFLDTAAYPDPDLIIRSGGEQRLSNFLLWQASYAELYFTPTLWPDFKEEHLSEASKCFAARDRRFGLIKQ